MTLNRRHARDTEHGAATERIKRNRALTALAVTLAIQAFTSLAATATSVLAPEIARDIGLPAKLIGVFVGLVYLGSMLASLASGGYIERYGSIRVSQIGVLLCGIGVALVCAPPWALVLAPIMIGLGYGPITPASSHLLVRTAPPKRMALTFSIKQTGVPLGAAKPNHALDSWPGRKSLTAGIAGSIGERIEVVTANGRSLPALTGSILIIGSNMTCT